MIALVLPGQRFVFLEARVDLAPVVVVSDPW
jgi:hypothetical protein